MSVPYDKQGEDGKFKPTYDPEEFVDAVADLDLPATADVAEGVECPHRTALHHLNKLEDAGRLTSRSVGAAKVWDVVDDAAATETPAATPEDTHDAHTGAETDPLDVLASVDLPGTVALDDAAAAVAAARDYIRDAGGATKQDLVLYVMPAHPLGYDVDAALAKVEAGERYRGAWWRRVVKPGLKALDDVETPAPGASEWNATETEI